MWKSRREKAEGFCKDDECFHRISSRDISVCSGKSVRMHCSSLGVEGTHCCKEITCSNSILSVSAKRCLSTSEASLERTMPAFAMSTALPRVTKARRYSFSTQDSFVREWASVSTWNMHPLAANEG